MKKILLLLFVLISGVGIIEAAQASKPGKVLKDVKLAADAKIDAETAEGIVWLPIALDDKYPDAVAVKIYETGKIKYYDPIRKTALPEGLFRLKKSAQDYLGISYPVNSPFYPAYWTMQDNRTIKPFMWSDKSNAYVHSFDDVQTGQRLETKYNPKLAPSVNPSKRAAKLIDYIQNDLKSLIAGQYRAEWLIQTIQANQTLTPQEKKIMIEAISFLKKRAASSSKLLERRRQQKRDLKPLSFIQTTTK